MTFKPPMRSDVEKYEGLPPQMLAEVIQGIESDLRHKQHQLAAARRAQKNQKRKKGEPA